MSWSQFKSFIFLLFFADLVFLNILVYRLWPPSIIPKSTSSITTFPTPSIFPSPTAVQAILPSPSPVLVTIPAKTVKIVNYLPVVGPGQSQSLQWENLPGTEFYLNTADFPNLIDAYFEANLKLLNGNGLAYLRLFDVTAGIEVWGSEVYTNKQTPTVATSAKLTLRSGNHLYRVQAKSLTADTTVFNSGRIKLITQN